MGSLVWPTPALDQTPLGYVVACTPAFQLGGLDDLHEVPREGVRGGGGEQEYFIELSLLFPGLKGHLVGRVLAQWSEYTASNT